VSETDWQVGSPLVHRGAYQGRPYVDKGDIIRIDRLWLRRLAWSPVCGTGMADLTRTAPAPAYGLPAPFPTESSRAVGAVALDWRRALGDLLTSRTLEQRDRHPVARAHRPEERDLTRGLASGTQ
jgi:hypothetical protein